MKLGKTPEKYISWEKQTSINQIRKNTYCFMFDKTSCKKTKKPKFYSLDGMSYFATHAICVEETLLRYRLVENTIKTLAKNN
jgi:hypothetical protein